MTTAITLPDTHSIAYWVRKASTEYAGGSPLLYRPCSNAPGTYKDLMSWSKDNVLGVDPIPVFNGGCDATIYPTPDDNHMFRAWHDAVHIREGLAFTQRDELRVSNLHCSVLRYIGAPYQVIKAVEADTKGQVLYYYETGAFITDQKQFVADCLAYGIPAVMNGVKQGARY